MVTPIDELKVRAKKLFKLASHPPQVLKIANGRPVQLKHCQHLIALKLGFRDWHHASEVLVCGAAVLSDYGRFWYQDKCAVSLNHWCKDLTEANSVVGQNGGVILPFKKQFFVAGATHFNALGMAYDVTLWREIQGNWVQGNREHRLGLALQRINADNSIRFNDCDVMEA